MATKKISDYSAVVTPANSDLLLQDNGSNYNNISLDQLSEFVQRDSDYAILIETRTSDNDYAAADLETDHRIFANSTAGDITLGFFNGSIRDGAKVTIKNVGTANQINIELVSSGVTDIILTKDDVLTILWDDTNSKWQILDINRDQLYSFIVSSQADFNSIIERVAANQYKIRNDIKSLYAANLSGGYLMTGGTSPLSGGDTWGYIETNNCKQIIFEKGAAIHMGNERGYLKVNTNDCYLLNISIIGTGTVTSAIEYSFLIDALRVVVNGCQTYDRLSTGGASGLLSGFKGNTVAANRKDCKYINCIARNLECDSGNVVGFNNLENGVNLSAYILTGSFAAYGISGCDYITNCRVDTLVSSAQDAEAFLSCEHISNCEASNISSTGQDAIGFSNCNNLNNCNANIIDHTGSVAGKSAYGFNNCTQLSSCKAEDVDTNGAAGEAHGFKDCDNGSACYATTCNNGFDGCRYINSSVSESNSLVGFQSCFYLGACSALTNTGDGFDNSDDIANCSSDGNGGHGFDSCERIVASVAVNNSGWGFRNSKQLSICRSTGNTTGQYTNCFADFGSANAVADTAAGGYNG